MTFDIRSVPVQLQGLKDIESLFRRCFVEGVLKSDSIAESSPYQKKRPRLVSPLEDMPTVREIIHDVVDKEKQSIRPSPHD
jgi:hypothetical protein